DPVIGMSARSANFLRVGRADGIPTEDILPMRDGVEMIGVDTRWHPTRVIEFEAFGHGSPERFVHDHMGATRPRRHARSSRHAVLAIAERGALARPNPTTTHGFRFVEFLECLA